MDTSGYYKVHNGHLLYGSCNGGQQIINKSYSLDRSDITQESDGWKWFDSEEESRIFYGDLIIEGSE